MKKIKTYIPLAAMLLASMQVASATPQLRLSDGTTTIVVTDGDALDASPTAGSVEYSGPVGSTWVLDITVGVSKPDFGTASAPHLDIDTTSISQGPGTLTIELTDDDFTAAGPAFASIGGNSDGSVTFTTWTDPANTLFGETSLITSLGPTVGSPFSASGNGTVNPPTPNSLTLKTVISHPGAGQTGFDAELFVTNNAPPPCNCTLTFNSPTRITNCAGDTIPTVTATEDCGSGPVSVPVTFVSAVTNGVCPQIITRTYTATNDCGVGQTFTQTLTLNCRGSICGHIFADCDGSGDLTAGDIGLSKVIVSLLSGNKVLTSMMTDSNGGYCFVNLAGGNYVVVVTPPTGYSQTAASTSYHWKDGYGRICWNENDGYIHCLSSGTECWWDKSNNCHYKDNYGRDCWKDNYGGYHCQPCSYQSCNAQTNNNKLSITLTNCASQSDVDFAYTGTKSSLSVCVTGPSYAKCGQSCTYTCTITNTGNVCFTGGTVCHTIGNCGWNGWNSCNNYNTTCPPLSPGQHCTITQKCTFNSWNCGTVACQSTVNCYCGSSNCSGQSVCYSQCGW